MDKIHIKKECVRREIVKQNHFVKKKVSLSENIITSGNH